MADLHSAAHDGPVSPAVAALQKELRDVVAEARALRADVQTAEQARRRANHINLAVLGLVVVFVLMLVGVGWQATTTNRQIADCTTPGGNCYEDGRARTSGAIVALTRISVYVSQCGRLYPGESGPEYDAKLERCVAEKLAAAQPSSPPSVSTSPR